MLKQKLLPNVWFHGTQSTSTGGRSSRKGHTCAAICWFEQSMRWVLTTPFGVPVEPEVKRIFAIASGPMRAKASSTRAVGDESSSAAIGVAVAPTAARAGAKRAGSEQ